MFNFDEQLDRLPRETLVELVRMYSRNWHTVDGLWFRGVEARFGMDAAIEIDIEMWKRMSATEARRIKEVLGIVDGGGVDAVLRAIHFMSWAPSSEYQVERYGDRTFLTCTKCPPQEARMRRGIGEFACRPTFEFGFRNVAEVIDPRVKVACRFCPPGPHPPDVWCQWEFRLEP